MRTLSARILLGFAVLTVTFGVITATIVFNMQVVEAQIQVVRRAYVPLALFSKDLAQREDDLKAYLDEGYSDMPNLISAWNSLNTAHDRRNLSLHALEQAAKNLGEVAGDDAKVFTQSIEQIESAAAALEPDYQVIKQAAQKSLPLDDLSFADALHRLKTGERRLAGHATMLAGQLNDRVQSRTKRVEDNEHTLRRWTIALGLAAVVLGLVMTLWVIITLRPLRKLREAARRVAAGNYDSRIPERGPTEVAGLARELNSMARAVEERERELVRSERLAAVGKMAAMITHEVRNPLSSIGLNTELLEEELEDGPSEAKDLLGAIHREVDRLTAITEEYLAFARLPKPKLAYEAVNPMVGALAAFVREDLAAKNVRADRCRAAPPVPDQPRAQRDRGGRRQGQGQGHAAHQARRRARRRRGRGRRHRHPGRCPAPAVRSVLLDEGGRQRPGPRAHPADRQGSRRRSRGRQHRRQRHGVSRRGPCPALNPRTIRSIICVGARRQTSERS